MAARQNQGYLIWIIVLVILSLVLALTSFLGIQKALEYADVNRQTEAKLKQQTALAETRQIQAQILTALIGNQGESISEVDTNLDSMDAKMNGVADADRAAIGDVIKKTGEVYDDYKKDMNLLLTSGGGGTNPQATYRGVFESLAAALKRRVDDITTLQNEITRTKLDAETEIKGIQARLDETIVQLAAVTKDFETEKTRRAEDQNTFQVSTSQIEADNKQKNDSFLREQEKINELTAQLESKNQVLADTNVELKDKVDKYEAENFDRADGKIVRVMDGLHKVIIDLGSADGLRNNQSFAVYDQGVTNFEKNAHKAALEIVRISGPHSAEARITSEALSNPILGGDPILSAVWDPGNRVEIALAGVFDLDYDGFDDRDKLIQDIEANGGKVVAWHDDEGVVHGEIGPSTRYFVQGDAQPPGPDFNAAVAKAARDMKQMAVDANTQVIDTRKLLLWIGRFHKTSPVIPLDDNIGTPFMRREIIRKQLEDQQRSTQSPNDNN